MEIIQRSGNKVHFFIFASSIYLFSMIFSIDNKNENFVRIILSIIGFVFVVAVIALMPISRNYVIKNIAEYYLSSDSMKIRIDSLDVYKTSIIAKNTTVYFNDKNLTTIENILITYDLNEILNNKKLNFTLKLQDKTTFLTKDATFEIDIAYAGNTDFSNSDAQVTISRFSSELFADLGINILEGVCDISFDSGVHSFSNCKITDGNAKIEIDAKIASSENGFELFSLKGYAKELPVDLHKAFHHMVAENATMQYLYDNISGAILKEGHWNINLDKEYFSTMHMKPEYIDGEFVVENISLSYDKDFPNLEKINTKLVMRGSILDFGISSAYSNETLLSNAKVLIDWGVEESKVIIDAEGNGPAVNLINFIPKKQLENLTESGLDLSKIKGDAATKLHMIVPIGDEKNTYDISSTISNVGLIAYDNALVLRGATIKAVFDGNIVNVKGSGLINDFVSNINISNFMDPKSEFDNVIEISAKLAPPSNSESLRPYSIVSGNAILEFSYKDKGEKSYIFAKSNLMNAEFGIDKLGIHSRVGDKAQLEIKGETSDDGSIPLNLKLTGENGFHIIGVANITKDITKISLSKIRAHDTDARAEIDFGKKNMKFKFRGKMLDLSQANMMMFLAKNSDGVSTSLDVLLDRVKLKNEIYLDDFVLNMKCDSKRCYNGVMSSKIGTRDFRMLLSSKDDYEEWSITTDNAGAILKGVGMLENVKSGTLNLKIETRRSDVKAGEVIPIAKGDFTLEKFVTVDNKFLTRLISFTSIPGLMNFIRMNHDISFTKMSGNFSYKDDVLNIFDGSAEGPFMDLTMKGDVFTKERKMKVKGKVSPSKYGPGIVAKIPIIGAVFKVTPYSLEYKY